ncbi:hypothetical protein DM01DRAFT_1388691 [Hesseltinella vesiculosa]|uniref:Uncharacterized protein n=1 Tax=Hesseltinella vesiculosa TaxID=101127 RepID=A0A1X2GMQ6_9FUNG|nr:hypothetical protein DM01DRAFT_1388691 [Hesseltinella vesiculosa]
MAWNDVTPVTIKNFFITTGLFEAPPPALLGSLEREQIASTHGMTQSTDATIARLRNAGLPKGIIDDITSASEIDHDSFAFPMPWDTGKDVTVNDLMFLFNLENENADGISHRFDMDTEKKQLEEVVGTDDEPTATSIMDLHHFAMLVNNTVNAIPFNTETEMELSIILGKVASTIRSRSKQKKLHVSLLRLVQHLMTIWLHSTE